MRRFSGAIALGCALVVALTGCRLAGDHAAADGPPAGGWPQPAGAKVTAELCGLLTDGDYSRLGHDRQPNLSDSVNDRTNTVDCQSKANDEMTLTLDPTADFAKYDFAAGLADHKAQLAGDHRRSALANDVVGAADESWFDDWTAGTAEAERPAHELRLRRGALILGITLSGDRGAKEKDPRSVLITLANLVLRRLPHAGTTDLGKTHKVQYEAIGAGKAKTVTWEDYVNFETSGAVDNVRLPWLRTIPMAAFDGDHPNRALIRVEASSDSAKVGCLIVIDNVPVDFQKPTKRFAECESDIPEASDGPPPSAQPAGYRSNG